MSAVTLEKAKGQLSALVSRTEVIALFKSGNTGVRTALTLKAPEARALGLLMPAGSKLVMSVSAYIVDPANGKDA